MSPILLRPIREQIEHDRVIRQLQAKWKRRYEVAINTGQREDHSVRSSGKDIYPDVILTNVDGPRRLHAVIEVETAESVNHLEAMAQWDRTTFHSAPSTASTTPPPAARIPSPKPAKLAP